MVKGVSYWNTIFILLNSKHLLLMYSNYFVFDFETGGLYPNKNAAVEIGCVMVDGRSLQIIDSYQSLIRPYDDRLTIEDQALRANGIRREELPGGKPLIDVLNELIEFIKKNTPYKQKKFLPIMVGQNILFDVGFWQQIFSYYPKKIDWTSLFRGKEGFNGQFIYNIIDTTELMFMGYAHDETVTKHTLSVICEILGVSLTDAHRAMNDVIATYEVLKIFCKRMRNISGSSEVVTNQNDYREHFKI